MKTRGKDKKPRAGRGAAIRFLEDVVLKHQEDECLFWPFSRTTYGYGQVKYEGSVTRVHVLSCEEENGPKPSDDYEACHSCTNGSLGCVSRKHLRWGTHQENKDDEIAHGTRCKGETHGRHKLTTADVRIIRRLVGRVGREELAGRFNVSSGTIKDVQTRRSWSWLG